MLLVIIIVVIILVAAIGISAVIISVNNKNKMEEIKRNEIENNRQLAENIEQSNNEITDDINKANIDPDTGWNLDKVVKVTSEDNRIVPVPIGYAASTIEGEKSVSTGFVIKEGTDGSKTSGVNEFVWVPIYSMEEIYDSTYHVGQLWDFGTPSSPNNPAVKRYYSAIQNSGYREPDVVTNGVSGEDSTSGTIYDAASNYLEQAGLELGSTATDFKAQLQSEFNSMISSIKTYGGFYIGRYETGNLSLASGDKAVVQKYNTDIANQNWYVQYKVNKTIAANDNVTTSMIWGCQWDATLRWMQRYGTTETVKKFTTDSTFYGNYKDNVITYKTSETAVEQQTVKDEAISIPTGGSEITKINNIYDMAGNVADWTLEAGHAHSRTCRGGNYYISGSYNSAGGRSTNYPNYNSPLNGSRATLYINI